MCVIKRYKNVQGNVYLRCSSLAFLASKVARDYPSSSLCTFSCKRNFLWHVGVWSILWERNSGIFRVTKRSYSDVWLFVRFYVSLWTSMTRSFCLLAWSYFVGLKPHLYVFVVCCHTHQLFVGCSCLLSFSSQWKLGVS